MGLAEHVVNLLHDFLRPLNRGTNQLVRPGTSLWPSKQIIGGLHVQTGENRCHDADHSFHPQAILGETGMLRFGKLLIRKVPRERGVLTRDNAHRLHGRGANNRT